MTFAEGAARLSGQAGLLLGWRPAEFWAATPAELESVIRAGAGADGAPAAAADLRRLKELFPDG